MAVSDRQDVVALFRELVRVAQGSRKDWQTLAAARSPRPIESMTGAPIDEEGMQKAAESRASEESAAASAHGRRVESAKQRSQDFAARIARAEALPEAAMGRLGLKELPAVEAADGEAMTDPNAAVNDFERHSKAMVARSLGPSSTGLPLGRLALVVGAVAIVAVLFMMNQPQQSTPNYIYNPTQPIIGDATPTDGAMEAQTDTPQVVDTSSAVPVDVQPSPNTIAGPAASLPPAVSLTTGLPYSGSDGNGGLQGVGMTPSGPRTDTYAEAHQTKSDVHGNPVPGDQVGSASADQTGEANMEVPPGTYVVLCNLTGYNWGDVKTNDGQSGVTVVAGATTRVTISMGSITFVPTKIDDVIAGQYAEIHLEKTDSGGGIVTGDQVASGNTDNTGAITLLVTPGNYIVRSNFTGYNWGNLSDGDGIANVVVAGGSDTPVKVQLGRIRVAVPQGTYVEAHLEKAGSSGSVTGDQVASGNSDNTGYWSVDLSAGSYTLVINGHAYSGVKVTGGNLTDFKP